MSPTVETACDGRSDQLVVQGSYSIPKSEPIEIGPQGIIDIPWLPPRRDLSSVFLEWNTTSGRWRLIHGSSSRCSGGCTLSSPGCRDHLKGADGNANAKARSPQRWPRRCQSPPRRAPQTKVLDQHQTLVRTPGHAHVAASHLAAALSEVSQVRTQGREPTEVSSATKLSFEQLKGYPCGHVL